MAEVKNYLLGYGERLAESLDPPRLTPNKQHPYSFQEAKVRLRRRLNEVSEDVDALPDSACPHDEAVAILTLHPAYLAKSYFPSGLLRAVGLEAVGSRASRIVPDKGGRAPRSKKKDKDGPNPAVDPVSTPTAEIFVAGPRERFRTWAAHLNNWSELRAGADELVRIEDFYMAAPERRLQRVRSKKDAPMLEIVLHAPSSYVIEGFRDYMRELDIRVDLNRRFQLDGLCFIGARVPKELHVEMAKYAFLRVAREMPRLRELRPATPVRSFNLSSFPVALPKKGPLNSDLRVALFDGGIPSDAALDPWVQRKKTLKLGSADAGAQSHGLGVTSALLFGPLEEKKALPQPFASVDHYRVIDENTQDPEGNYYDVLERITSVLSQKQYDFVNLSLGPEVAFDDNEVHLWTLQLDQLFANGKTFVTVAAGNTGEADLASGVARIQSPSDAVNVLGVGASDSLGKKWKRASYSSLGPGRTPGIMKPDIVAFGGCRKEPFWLLGPSGDAAPNAGTSFSSPFALRTAIGIRTYLGSIVQPIALKALLIHHSQDDKNHCHEVGWGRIPSEIEQLIVCGPGKVHVLYQGQLEAGKYLRARIPVPANTLPGKVEISATFCYATETDPQDTVTYTRAGLEVKFRPDKTKRTRNKDGKLPLHQDTMPFFQQKKLYNTEEQLRRDAHQWETCLKRSRSFRGTSINDPVFDIHYNARKGGIDFKGAKPIPYALVVTVHAKNVTDLYDKVAQRYRTQLEALKPVIHLPVRVS